MFSKYIEFIFLHGRGDGLGVLKAIHEVPGVLMMLVDCARNLSIKLPLVPGFSLETRRGRGHKN